MLCCSLAQERWALLEQHKDWDLRPARERASLREALLPYVRVCTLWGEPLLGRSRISPGFVRNAIRYSDAGHHASFELEGRSRPSG